MEEGSLVGYPWLPSLLSGGCEEIRTRLHVFTDISSLGRKQSYCGLEIVSYLVKIRFCQEGGYVGSPHIPKCGPGWVTVIKSQGP